MSSKFSESFNRVENNGRCLMSTLGFSICIYVHTCTLPICEHAHMNVHTYIQGSPREENDLNWEQIIGADGSSRESSWRSKARQYICPFGDVQWPLSRCVSLSELLSLPICKTWHTQYCVCVCLWKPEVTIRCLPQLLFLQLIFWDRISLWAWSCRIG